MIEIKFNPSILKKYFDLKVREQCRSCKRYGAGQCPPNLPSIDYYKTLLPSYENGVIFYEQFSISNKDWETLGRKSSLILHKDLLKKRQELLNKGKYYVIVFGGGSCKTCLNCVTPCRQPDKAIVPLEGCGIDVVKLMKHFNIKISFPVENKPFFYRIGLVLYDN